MTFQPVPIVPFEELAADIPGFSSDESQLNDSLRTTIFINGASASSKGRASTSSEMKVKGSGCPIP